MSSSTAILKIVPTMTALTTLGAQAKVFKKDKGNGVKKIVKVGAIGIVGAEFVKLQSGLLAGL